MMKDAHGITIAEQREEVQRLPPHAGLASGSINTDICAETPCRSFSLMFIGPYCPDAKTYYQNDTNYDDSAEHA